MFKYLFKIVFLMIPLFTQANDQTNPYYAMNDIVSKTFSRLRNEQNKIYNDPNHLRTIIREEMIPYVQVKYAGALILGHYYRESTLVQREAYFKIFQDYLEQIYGQALALYSNQTYKIDQEKPLGESTIITIRVAIIGHDSQPPVRIDFKWRKNSVSGNWQIYDMIVEGISILTTKQNEWSSILRTNGIDGLVKQLQLIVNQPIILDKKYNG